MAHRSPGNKYGNGCITLRVVLLAAGLIGFILSVIPEQYGDTLRYAFIFPDDYYADFEGRITDISDIFHSQANHWQTVNGRFFIHFIVQMFCSLLPIWAFAIINGAMWGVLFYILACFSRINRDSFCHLTSALLIYVLTLLLLSCDIPVQVNYVWTSVIVFGWIYCFLFHSSEDYQSAKSCLFFLIWGLIAGACHEGFSIPAGIALIVYIISFRSGITPKQVLGTISFLLGTLTLILAPGNFIRLQESAVAEFSLLNSIEQTIPALILPSIITVLCIFRGKIRKRLLSAPVSVFLIIIAISSCVISFFLKFKFGVRGVFPASLISVIIAMNLLGNCIISKPRLYTSLAWIIIILAVFTKIYCINDENRIYKDIEHQYFSSKSGRVFLPDKDYIKALPLTKDRILALEQTQHSLDSTASPVVLLPYSFKGLHFGKYSNIAYEFKPQAWIIIQSKSAPIEFSIKKIVFPGIFNFQCAPRSVNFNDLNDIAVDTIGDSRIAVYINKRRYLRSEVESIGNKTLSK